MNKERWHLLTLAEQLGNIGSEVSRAKGWQGRDEQQFWNSVARAIELFDLTLEDSRWRGRHYEIGRAKEVFSDAVFGGKLYQTSLEDIDRYLLNFALFARSNF